MIPQVIFDSQEGQTTGWEAYTFGLQTTDRVSYPGFDKFRDESGSASQGNLISYIEPDDAAYAQADWFAPNKANGLTKVGLSGINQSIEAFVYFILGAQVNVRSSPKRVSSVDGRRDQAARPGEERAKVPASGG